MQGSSSVYHTNGDLSYSREERNEMGQSFKDKAFALLVGSPKFTPQHHQMKGSRVDSDGKDLCLKKWTNPALRLRQLPWVVEYFSGMLGFDLLTPNHPFPFCNLLRFWGMSPLNKLSTYYSHATSILPPLWIPQVSLGKLEPIFMLQVYWGFVLRWSFLKLWISKWKQHGMYSGVALSFTHPHPLFNNDIYFPPIYIDPHCGYKEET